MKKYIVVFEFANGTCSTPARVVAHGFKSAIAAGQAVWKTQRLTNEAPIGVKVTETSEAVEVTP